MIPGRLTFIALASLGLFCGCGWWIRVTEVSGTVTVNGKPMKGLRVVFEPEARERPRALATTTNDGRYILARLGPGNKTGAVQGRYTVKVLADDEDEDAPKIPAEYGAASTLSFEVVAGKPNVFDIDVKTK